MAYNLAERLLQPHVLYLIKVRVDYCTALHDAASKGQVRLW